MLFSRNIKKKMTNQKYLICDLYDYYSSQSLYRNILRNIIDFI